MQLPHTLLERTIIPDREQHHNSSLLYHLCKTGLLCWPWHESESTEHSYHAFHRPQRNPDLTEVKRSFFFRRKRAVKGICVGEDLIWKISKKNCKIHSCRHHLKKTTTTKIIKKNQLLWIHIVNRFKLRGFYPLPWLDTWWAGTSSCTHTMIPQIL